MGIHEHRTCAWQSVVMPLALSGMDRVVKTKIESELNTDTKERDGERERGVPTLTHKKNHACSHQNRKRNALVWYFYLRLSLMDAQTHWKECAPLLWVSRFLLKFLKCSPHRLVSLPSVWEYLCCLLLACNKWPSMHHLCLKIDTRWVLWHHLACLHQDERYPNLRQQQKKGGELYNFMAWSLINGIWGFVSYLGNHAKCGSINVSWINDRHLAMYVWQV